MQRIPGVGGAASGGKRHDHHDTDAATDATDAVQQQSQRSSGESVAPAKRFGVDASCSCCEEPAVGEQTIGIQEHYRVSSRALTLPASQYGIFSSQSQRK